MWIMPVAQQPAFEAITDDECRSLATFMKRLLAKLHRVLDRPAYNWVIHSSNEPHYQWHIEILPRTSCPAGYEWATGTFINPVFPEVAARRLISSADQ
jgi:UDPglucose--hexose-1-phosphate uridylyltransferase